MSSSCEQSTQKQTQLLPPSLDTLRLEFQKPLDGPANGMLLFEIGEDVLFSYQGRKLIEEYKNRTKAMVIDAMNVVGCPSSAVRLVVALALMLGGICAEKLASYFSTNRAVLSNADRERIDSVVRRQYHLPVGTIRWLLE